MLIAGSHCNCRILSQLGTLCLDELTLLYVLVCSLRRAVLSVQYQWQIFHVVNGRIPLAGIFTYLSTSVPGVNTFHVSVRIYVVNHQIYIHRMNFHCRLSVCPLAQANLVS